MHHHLLTIAHLEFVMPRVREITPAPTPVERDPFLDGLDGGTRTPRDQRARVLASLVARPDSPQPGRAR